MSATTKQITNFRSVESDRETVVVDGIWASLLIGERQDGREVIELRTWKDGMLQEVVTEWFDRRVRKHRLEEAFDTIKAALADEKLDNWCDYIRHG